MLFQSIILGLIQGITEFLPISSSGHLIIIPRILGWQDQGLAFDAMIHLGTLLAIVVYFFSDIKLLFIALWKIITGSRSEFSHPGHVPAYQPYKRIWIYIILTSIPAALIGFLLKDFPEESIRRLLLISINLIVWGLLLIYIDFIADKKSSRRLANLGYARSFFIGLMQALALIPGTSRSGMTISAGVLSDMNRKDAVRYAFLAGIPVIFGAGMLSLFDLLQMDVMYTPGEMIAAFIAAFISGLLAIYLLMRFLHKRSLSIFGIYRILLGLGLIIYRVL